MNFNKAMIDLVRELRRRAPSEAKPGIKLANPELLQEMVPWYQSSNDTVVKALIKELFSQAGSEWQALLEKSGALEQQSREEPFVPEKKRYVTQVYRGQTRLVEAPSVPDEPRQPTQRIYRGQLVRA